MKQTVMSKNDLLQYLVKKLSEAEPITLQVAYKLFNTNTHVGYDYHNGRFIITEGVKSGEGCGH